MGGGGGGQEPLILADVICEQPLMAPNKSGLLAPTHEHLDSTASTGQLEQKMTLFAIFRDVTGGTDTRKIVKNRSHIAKFGCGSGAILVILFKKIGYFFQKSVKNGKKLRKIF